ncbi:hypothetical protein IFM89_032124, partial [Coptis chinensis]
EKVAAEAKERAAVARVEADAYKERAEQASGERATAEACERGLLQRLAERAAARESQQKNENDLESFFTESTFESQLKKKPAPETARRTSSGTSSTMRKASSTTNIVDDLTSIFGGASSSGEFQDVEGETEERRRARLDRHQRTQERAVRGD